MSSPATRDPIDRYARLVDDEEAFRAACARPLPSVVRVNTIKTSPARAATALREEGVAFQRAEWHDGLFRLPDGSPGTTWPYVHGWLHGQEEVSVLPALALDPDDCDRVWDACAAPGSKTGQLSALMNDRGTLVANDSNLGRISALRHNAERLGLTNLVITHQDARNYSLSPVGIDEFDGVLVDAPCSCEGTVRKNPDIREDWTIDHVKSVASIQKGILRRAVQVARRGGTVVYATCTFAPEENEAVVSHVLSSEDCEVVEWDAPVETRPGVREWDGESFDSAVGRTSRVYPHLNDTGGFYVAKLRVGS